MKIRILSVTLQDLKQMPFIQDLKPLRLKICMYMYISRAPDKVRIFISETSISWPNPMFDRLLELSHRDNSNKWSNIGFGQEIKE